MYRFARQLLFCLPTELSHRISMAAIDLAASLPGRGVEPGRAVKAMGLTFPNPVGLAAGLDKDARHIDGLAALGFGCIEVGTVTPRPQPGNPMPRLFRLPQAEAIINRMGFNNLGVAALVEQVQASKFDGLLGINIGKNKDTPEDKAVDDYLLCMRAVYPYASYITVNLSSPNTPGLRDLQFGEPLKQLLAQLKEAQQHLASEHGSYTPLVVKIAPDLAADDVEDIAGSLKQFEIDGVIATNTTLKRDVVTGLPHAEEAGGLSGAPLTSDATKVLKQLRAQLGSDMAIIASGGIMDVASAEEKIAAGADLVQLYTGFIYRGPGLITDICKAL